MLLLATILAAKANPVDMRTAREVAVKFLNANTKIPLRGIDDLQLATIYKTESGIDAFHIFNTPNGFVIVSADDCATPILGYSDEGRPFDSNNVPIQLQGYLLGFVEQIQYGIENQIEDESIARQWELVRITGRLNNNRDGEVVEPLVTALWGQGCYYNNMCPEDALGVCGHAKVGCVATAMGMILHYWGYPTHGFGEHTYNPYFYPEQSVNFSETTYDWANMPDQLNESSTQTEIDAVSTLLWHCGVAVDMGYDSGSSGAYDYMAREALNNYFGYPDAYILWLGLSSASTNGQHVFDYEGWINLMKTNLLMRHPLYYSGFDDNGYGGHAWVCDGFDSEGLFHFNWGWQGEDNGYFSLFSVNLNPYQFNTSHCAIFNIYPKCEEGIVYQVSTESNLDEAGLILGEGTYSCGQICNVMAVSNPGYDFVNWTDSEVVVSLEPIYTFTVNEDRFLVASFMSHEGPYCIMATAELESGGTIIGGGEYENGQTCTLSAMANNGYSFSYWTEDGMLVSYDEEYVFTVTSDRNIVAHFVEENASLCNFVIRVSHSNGMINTDIAITYDNDSTETFNVQGSGQISLERTVQSGSQIEVCWTFLGEGATVGNLGFEICYGNGFPIHRCVQCGQDCYSFTADCELAWTPHAVSASSNPSGGGSVTGEGVYEAGATCVLMAIPDMGYSFVNWTENDEVVSTESMYLFNVFEDRNLTANFSLPFTITATANPTGFGTVTNGTGSYIYGQNCTVSAEANEGYTFCYWTENNNEIVSYESDYSFTVLTNRDLVANFVEGDYPSDSTCGIVFEITSGFYGEQGNYLVVDYGNGTFEKLSSVGLVTTYTRYVADGSHIGLSWISGYGFWSCNFSIRYENEILIYSSPSFDLSDGFHYEFDLVCDEAYNPYRMITVSTNPVNGGIVNGAGLYNVGDVCTLTAIANEGYSFKGWVENGVLFSLYSEEISFPVGLNRNITAVFYPLTISVTANPENSGYWQGDGYYDYGESCTLYAEAIDGYTFLNWTKDGEVVSTEATYSFIVTEEAAFVANFEEIPYITQTTNFNNGWTWWSSCIETEGNVVLEQLKTGLGESGVIIKSQSQSTMHLGNNWVGTLPMNNEGSYMVKATAIVSVDITGPAATPENHPISLNSGWTWIGYPSTETMTVAEALANHTPQANDVIKGQSASAIYMAGQWRGSLTLTPGIGLMYKSNNSEAVTFTYATPSRMGATEINTVEPHWNANYSAYPTNMTVLAVVELDGKELAAQGPDANYELDAFANGECRGSVSMMYVEPLDRYMALLTIAGEETDQFRFALYNTETGEEYHNSDEILIYETDGVVGSPEAPLVIRFRGTIDVDEWVSSLQIFPNPVEHGQNISLGKTDELGEVQVEIINALGMVVETWRAASLQSITAPKVAGVYTLRITAEGKGTCYRKLVVK